MTFTTTARQQHANMMNKKGKKTKSGARGNVAVIEYITAIDKNHFATASPPPHEASDPLEERRATAIDHPVALATLCGAEPLCEKQLTPTGLLLLHPRELFFPGAPPNNFSNIEFCHT